MLPLNKNTNGWRRLSSVSGCAIALCTAMSLSASAQTPTPAATPPPAPPTTPAPGAPPAAPPPPAANASVPEGTSITVALKEDLHSGGSKEGAEIPFTVAKDVTGAGGVVLIQSGTPAVGHVIQSKKAGLIGKPGKLGFTCDYVVLANGAHIPLRSSQDAAKYGRDNRAASVGAAVVLTPLALLVPGKNTTAKAGTQFTLFVDKTTPMTPPAGGAS